jgi:NADH-quinone oxidoreductase subunit A
VYSIENVINSFFSFALVSILLVVILISIMFILSFKNFDQEKILPYECGFEEFSSTRNLFDIKYYIIAILFLLFDIETVYIMPWTLSINFYDLVGFMCSFVFIFLLILGFNFEWLRGSLDWMNYVE